MVELVLTQMRRVRQLTGHRDCVNGARLNQSSLKMTLAVALFGAKVAR
jgi:hypothetical protein